MELSGATARVLGRRPTLYSPSLTRLSLPRAVTVLESEFTTPTFLGWLSSLINVEQWLGRRSGRVRWMMRNRLHCPRSPVSLAIAVTDTENRPGSVYVWVIEGPGAVDSSPSSHS